MLDSDEDKQRLAGASTDELKSKTCEASDPEPKIVKETDKHLIVPDQQASSSPIPPQCSMLSHVYCVELHK
jgi:hypothetical protein